MLRRSAQASFSLSRRLNSRAQISVRWNQSSQEKSKDFPFQRFSPFVDTPGRSINVLKAYSFYYAHPHPELTPNIFLTTTLFNELGSIGLLSHQMRNYPHRIQYWTRFLLQELPSFTEAELRVIDKRSLQDLKEKHSDPLKFLIDRRKNLIASTLYTVKDVTSARFASEHPEFEEIDFDPDSLLYGKFLETARSIELDNPILFNDTTKALITQYLKIVKLPHDDLMQISFPYSYWNLWWSLFYLTGDTAPVVAITTTISNYLVNESRSVILDRAIQQLTTNAYQHTMVYSTLSALEKKNQNCKWLSSVLQDVDKLNHEYGAFKLSVYDRETPITIPSNNKALLLEHFPNFQSSLSLILPPVPSATLKDKFKETTEAAKNRGFMMADGSFDEDVMVETFSLLMENHAKKEQEIGHALKEEITLTHELLFNALEIHASSLVSNIAVVHCLAKMCVLFYANRRPEGYMNLKVSNDRDNIKAIFWYNKLLDLQPREPILNYELGIFLKAIGDKEASMGLLEKALRLDGVDVGTPLTEVMNDLGILTHYEDDF